MPPKSLTPEQYRMASEASHLLAEELIKRGEEMLKLGRQLLMQSADLASAADGQLFGQQQLEQEDDRSMGKRGEIRIGEAIHAARHLGTFTRPQFADATGLNPTAAMKWLAVLMNNKPHPIIKRVGVGRGTQYEYIQPPEGSSPEPKQDPPELALITESPARGQEVKLNTLPLSDNKEVNKWLRAAAKQGWVIQRDGGGHIGAYKDGERLRISKTPPQSGVSAVINDFKKRGVSL